jgi:hypothetical protein
LFVVRERASSALSREQYGLQYPGFQATRHNTVYFVTASLKLFYLQIVLMLMTSAVASPQNGRARIEQNAPPIPIAYSPPRVPAPIYGAPPFASEGSLISPASIQINQSPAPTPQISASIVQPEGAVSSPALVLDETVPIRPPEELVHIPGNSVSIPQGSDRIVLPPGTIISLRDDLGQFSHG